MRNTVTTNTAETLEKAQYYKIFGVTFEFGGQRCPGLGGT